MKKLSLVTPLYRTKKQYLIDAMKPLKKYSEVIEWVLVNDSPDDLKLKAYLSDIYDPNYMVITENEKNVGIFKSYYNGFMIASGEYCCILDHDDVFEPGKILSALNSNPDIAYTNEYKFNDEDDEYYEEYIKPEFDLLSIISYYYTHHVTVLKTEIIKTALMKKGIDCNYKSLFDIHMIFEYINCLFKNKIEVIHVNSADYGWRVHQDSTAMNLEQKVSGYYERLRRVELFYKEHNETPMVNLHTEVGYVVESRFLSVLDEFSIPMTTSKLIEVLNITKQIEGKRFILQSQLGKQRYFTYKECKYFLEVLLRTPLNYLNNRCINTIFIPSVILQDSIGEFTYNKHVKDVIYIKEHDYYDVIKRNIRGIWIRVKSEKYDDRVSCLMINLN